MSLSFLFFFLVQQSVCLFLSSPLFFSSIALSHLHHFPAHFLYLSLSSYNLQTKRQLSLFLSPPPLWPTASRQWMSLPPLTISIIILFLFFFSLLLLFFTHLLPPFLLISLFLPFFPFLIPYHLKPFLPSFRSSRIGFSCLSKVSRHSFKYFFDCSHGLCLLFSAHLSYLSSPLTYLLTSTATTCLPPHVTLPYARLLLAMSSKGILMKIIYNTSSWSVAA